MNAAGLPLVGEKSTMSSLQAMLIHVGGGGDLLARSSTACGCRSVSPADTWGMAYDEELADRIRLAVEGEPGLSEKAMFGGLAFLINGHLAVSAGSRGGLLLRVDPGETPTLI